MKSADNIAQLAMIEMSGMHECAYDAMIGFKMAWRDSLTYDGLTEMDA